MNNAYKNESEVYFDDGADFFGHGRLVGETKSGLALVNDGHNGVRAMSFDIIKPLTLGK